MGTDRLGPEPQCVFGFPVPNLPKAQQKGVWFCSAPNRAASFVPPEPYTCGACGIQFQFYNNLLEHMQSHAGKGPSGPQQSQPEAPREDRSFLGNGHRT